MEVTDIWSQTPKTYHSNMGASLFELISGKNEVMINIHFIISINVSALGNEKMVNKCNKLSGKCVPGCPGASTVISQPLDSKLLPWLAIPTTQPWAPTQGHPGILLHCDNSGKKRGDRGREAEK